MLHLRSQVMDISEERHINPVRLQALIDQGPLLPKQAQYETVTCAFRVLIQAWA